MRRTHLAIILAIILSLGGGLGLLGCGEEETTTTTAAPTTTGPSDTGTTVAPPTGEPIVIGAVVSATGAASPLGEPERIVLQMSEKRINEAGGLLGRPIKIIIEDDKSDPKEAVTATQKLITRDKVVALIGSTISPSTLAMKPIINGAKIPLITMSAANAITDEPPIDWIWRTPPKDALAAGRVMKYISETLKLKKIAVLHDENAYGSSGAAEIEKQSKELGIEIVAKESYRTAETDLTAQLTKIKGESPEAVVVWGTNPGPAVAAKNMKQLSMNVPFVGSHGIANMKFIELAGVAAEGVVFPAGKILLPDSITNPAQKAVVDQFVAAYKAVTGQPPSTFAGHAFDAIGLLAQAIVKAQSTDAAAIQKALNETQGFAGPDGIYNYTATNHDGLTIDDMIMVKIEGGKWTLLQ